MRRHFIAAALLATAIVSAGIPAVAVAADGPAASRASTSRGKVIFQVSDNDAAKWNLALNNAKNVQQDLGAKNVDIEIVAYGPGIGMLKLESPVGDRVGEAIASGVKVVACENTMHAQKITRQDMLSKIGYVKVGVVELMQKQRQGYAYIRP